MSVSQAPIVNPGLLERVAQMVLPQQAVPQLKVARLRAAIFFIIAAVVAITPLALSRNIQTQYVMPKFIVIMIGGALLAGGMLTYALYERRLSSLNSPL